METNFTNLSNDTVSELRALLCDLNSLIENYCHVSSHLSKRLRSAIKAETKAIEKELDKRIS